VIENEWWSRYIKPRWHNREKRWVARKVQDVTNKGAPDVDACWEGCAVKIELKYANALPARPDTKVTFSRYSKDEPNRRTILSREQARNLGDWRSAGGIAYILIGIGKQWWFVDSVFFTNPNLVENDGVTVKRLDEIALLSGFREELQMVPEFMARNNKLGIM
jgi:hypothetical protein